MRSRVLHAMDYREVDVKPLLKPFVLDEEALEREIRRLTNPYIRWEAGTEVAPGGQVTCRLESACERFHQEKLRFAAGSGLFHKELEALSIGMAVGETREIDLPEGRVALTVTEVMNRIAPEPDDEMVKKLELDGVSTIAEYRAYLAVQQKEKHLDSALYEPVQYLRGRVLAESEFVLFKEDWRDAVERKLERTRKLSAQEGMVLEEMTPEQFNGRIPVKSYHELIAMLQDDEWDSLRMYLLGRHYAQADGFTAGEAGYKAYLQEYAQSWHTTVELAQETDPYESYLFNEYAWHAYDVMQQYVREQF